jgi:hypothetical protein
MPTPTPCPVCSKIAADEAVNESLDNFRRFYFRHFQKHQEDAGKQAFKYEGLPENGRYTRLLELCPGEQDEPIIVTLRCVSLDEPFLYAALSYTWGITAGKRTVRVNGKDVSVGISRLGFDESLAQDA